MHPKTRQGRTGVTGPRGPHQGKGKRVVQFNENVPAPRTFAPQEHMLKLCTCYGPDGSGFDIGPIPKRISWQVIAHDLAVALCRVALYDNGVSSCWCPADADDERRKDCDAARKALAQYRAFGDI